MALGSLERAFTQLSDGGRDAVAEDAPQAKSQILCGYPDE